MKTWGHIKDQKKITFLKAANKPNISLNNYSIIKRFYQEKNDEKQGNSLLAQTSLDGSRENASLANAAPPKTHEITKKLFPFLCNDHDFKSKLLLLIYTIKYVRETKPFRR